MAFIHLFPKSLLLMEREKANPGWELVLGALDWIKESARITPWELGTWNSKDGVKKSILGMAGRANPAGVGSVDVLCLIRDVGWEKE